MISLPSGGCSGLNRRLWCSREKIAAPTYTGSSIVGVCATAVVIIAAAIPASSPATANAVSHRRHRPGGRPPAAGGPSSRVASVITS